MRVFLSYADGDAQVARALSSKLRGEGLIVWDRSEDVRAGANWALEVGLALERSDAFVVLLSEHSSQSVLVNREIDYALTNRRFKDRLVPVLLDEAPEFPWILEEMSPVSAASPLDAVAVTVAERLRGVPVA